MADDQAQADQTPITVQVEGLGSLQFPAGTSQDVMKQAIDRQIAQSHIDKKQDVPHPLVQRLLSWLPAAGGAAGGILGGIGGTVLGMGVGGAPGAIGGAAIGGATGEAINELGNEIAGNPSAASQAKTPMSAMGEAASRIGTQAAVQGGSEAAGGLIGMAGKAVAPRLMQSAVKPSVDALMDRTGNMPTVIKTLLDNGISVTQSGVKKIYDLLGTNTATVKRLTDASTATIDPIDAVKPVYDLISARTNQVNASQDLKAMADAANQFLDEQSGSGLIKGGAPMTVAQAQAIKQGTYKYLGEKAYTGELKSADTDAQKAIAGGLRQQIEQAVPDVAPLNAQSSRLLDAVDQVAKRAGLSGNKDLGGIYWIAQHPGAFLAAQFDRSPAVKSLVARGLYSSAGAIAKTSPQLLRLAVQSLATAPDGGSQ